MMDLREAAQRVVDLFVWLEDERTGVVEPHLDLETPDFGEALTDLRDALAAPESDKS